MHELVERASAAGLTVHTEAADADLCLSADVGHTAYRIVQEALTNALKHAPGATLTVRTSVRDGVLELQIYDDGGPETTSSLGASGSGIGLRGMHARVAELGGELRTGREPDGGWRVSARLPVNTARA